MVTRTCPRCGKAKPVSDFARDASKASGRKSHCKACDAAKSRRWYADPKNRVKKLAAMAARRVPASPRFCSECDAPLASGRRVVCSRRCKDRRYRRLHPEAFAAKQARKRARRREREKGSA